VVAVVGRGRAVVVVRFVSGTAGRSQAALTPAELRWICQPHRASESVASSTRRANRLTVSGASTQGRRCLVTCRLRMELPARPTAGEVVPRSGTSELGGGRG
jgi:hypothetical protein